MSYRAGFVAIIGRPNAGKSTLLNAVLEFKLAIATHKAQTTRHQILGILSEEQGQAIFLDTPGVIDPKYKLQEIMMQTVTRSTRDADAIVHLVDGSRNPEEDMVWEYLRSAKKPALLVLNKMDISDETQLENSEKMCI